jgi:hypothetical protein
LAATGESTAQPDTATPVHVRRSHFGHRLAFTLVAILVVGILMVLPFVITSVFDDILSPQSNHLYFLTLGNTPQSPTRSRLDIEITAIDEWNHLATVRISGNHTCDTPCAWTDRLLFVAIPQTHDDGEGLPPTQAVTLGESDQEVDQVLSLPLEGEPIRYPFDHYTLQLGVVLQRLYPDGRVQAFSTEEAKGHLYLSVHQHAARTVMERPVVVDPQTVASDGAEWQYAQVHRLTFYRPLYLRVLAIMLIWLVAATAAYAVFMRPLDQLIINAGALILGVWGIRAILLGPNVPGITSVDLALSTVILFLLAAITVRTLWHLKDRADLALLNRKPPPTK